MKDNNNPFPLGERNPRLDDYFIGQSYVASLLKEDDLDIKISHVTFEAGCRNNWHIHHDGYQILLVTEGIGWYQEENQPARMMQAGDAIYIREGIKHWHGASQEEACAHIAITKGTYEWLEPVDDDWYEKL